MRIDFGRQNFYLGFEDWEGGASTGAALFHIVLKQ